MAGSRQFRRTTTPVSDRIERVLRRCHHSSVECEILEARSEFRPCPCPGAAPSPWPGSPGGRCPWPCDSCETSIAGREPASGLTAAVRTPVRTEAGRRRATTGAGGVSCLNVLPIVVPTARRLKAQSSLQRPRLLSPAGRFHHFHAFQGFRGGVGRAQKANLLVTENRPEDRVGKIDFEHPGNRGKRGKMKLLVTENRP